MSTPSNEEMLRYQTGSSYRVLVCGGREYDNYTAVYAVLEALHSAKTITEIVTGAASGADSIAQEWALRRQVNYIGCRAKWELHGKKAGPIRNSEMLDWAPDLVVAFPGGVGTADMVRKARSAGVPVKECE